MLDHRFDKNAIYLLSGTFGPDSQALLHMMMQEGIKPVVCCVNYHKFELSNDDFNHLRDYCQAQGLTFEGLDTDELPAEKQMREEEEFSEWARNIRYAFFKEVYQRYNAAALLIAHQQDDLLETYLLQIRGEIDAKRYGLAETTTIEGMIVIRPLLNFTHEDLIDYDRENRVPYSEANDSFQTEHTRSPVRREVAAMSEIDRERVLAEMNARNSDSISLGTSIRKSFELEDELEIRALIALPHDAFVTTLLKFVSRAANPVHLTAEKIAEIRKLCLAPQPNLSMKLAEDVYLIKEYDVLTIGHNFDSLPYTYSLEKPGVLNTPQFDLDFSMGAEDRGITADDYPITIRTALPSDTYAVHGFLYSVRSLFSNWSMPVKMRYIWPIFVNKNGKIIYVPRYRIKFREYHTSVLKLHLKVEE